MLSHVISYFGKFGGWSVIFSVGLMASSPAALASGAHSHKPVPKACTEVVKACRTAGYGKGRGERKGKGLWADCVRPAAKGLKVAGLGRVSKKNANACLKARRAARQLTSSRSYGYTIEGV